MNNTIIGSVNQSYKKLDEKVVSLIKKDKEEVNLDLHFKDSTQNTYSVNIQNAFLKSGTTKLPESLTREVESLDYEYKMGSLPKINHIWRSTGSFLCLWDYVNKNEIFRYECNETIGNVETIEIKDQIYLLVSTQDYLYLHGITINDKEKMKITSKVSVKSDGVIFSNFIVTNNSRPFMQGNDGHVYELNIATVDNNNSPKSCYTICHTASPILKFLPYFFKSAPSVPVKSMTIDKEKELLFLLLNDSSIHSVNIQGSQYLPIQRTFAQNLESIHHIPSHESKIINLMAVSNKGDRLYYSSKDKTINLIHTSLAPPLPGSLIFNSLTTESSELSFYNYGIFAAILNKSEKRYLVFTSANSVEEAGSKRILLEDVYSEALDKKIWSINETSAKESLKFHYFTETLVSPEISAREFSILSESGITHYIKQRPVDYLAEVVSENNPQSILAFLDRYGVVESCALAFLLACSERDSPGVNQFIRNAHLKEEGLLLYVARTIDSIWPVDILQDALPQEEFKSAQNKLDKLYKLITHENIEIEKNHLDFILRIIEGIAFVNFVHNVEWNQTRASLTSTSNGCKFGDFITTEEGALLSRDIILSAIKYSKLSNETNDYHFISNFLESNCVHLLGQDNITYYKGIENLQTASNESNFNDKEKILLLSLTQFKVIISLIEVETLKVLAHEYCSLMYHIGGIQLAYSVYRANSSHKSSVYEVIYTCIEDALNNEKEPDYGKSTIERALKLTKEEEYHFKIYQWLRDNGHNSLLVTIDSPSLEKYIKTQLPLPESLACMRHYHHYRKEYYLALRSLLELATKAEDISLETRVGCLQKAFEYLPLTKGDISEAEKTDLSLTYEEAKIQLSIYETLLEDGDEKAKLSAKKLGVSLQPADTLYHEYARAHSLYESALFLMDLMELYDWPYAEKAWTHIIDEYQDEEERLKSKIVELASRLYPSLSSFPLYQIYKILEEHNPKFSKDFARITLLEADIPEELLSDAKKAIDKE